MKKPLVVLLTFVFGLYFFNTRCTDFKQAEYPEYAKIACTSLKYKNKFAVSMPTFSGQISKVDKILDQWAKNTPKKINMDFYLFWATYNIPYNFSINLFRNQQSIYCNCNEAQKKYLISTHIMFLYMLTATHDAGYEHMLLTEPDVYVLNPQWGDAFLSISSTHEKWWIKGSPWLEFDAPWFVLEPTNGNSLYNVKSKSFLKFVYKALDTPPWILGFDYRLYGFYKTQLSSCSSRKKWIYNKFLYSSAIINLGLYCGKYQNTINLSYIKELYPDAYIAHISGCE